MSKPLLDQFFDFNDLQQAAAEQNAMSAPWKEYRAEVSVPKQTAPRVVPGSVTVEDIPSRG